ncbi:MAG: hypothetical protein VB141_13290, partial [Burkholderia gladioli]
GQRIPSGPAGSTCNKAGYKTAAFLSTSTHNLSWQTGGVHIKIMKTRSSLSSETKNRVASVDGVGGVGKLIGKLLVLKPLNDAHPSVDSVNADDTINLTGIVSDTDSHPFGEGVDSFNFQSPGELAIERRNSFAGYKTAVHAFLLLALMPLMWGAVSRSPRRTWNYTRKYCRKGHGPYVGAGSNGDASLS